MKCLGVDIGSSSIKIAEVEASSRTSTVTQIWEFGLSTDPMRDQALEVIEKLRAFSAQYPTRDAKWVIAVPQNSVSTRLRRFPFLDRQKILKSLPFELEEDIPFDADETVFDARVVETFSNGSDILAVACPFGPIEKALGRAKDGGFEAEIVSIEGLALSNILDAWWTIPVATPGPTDISDDAIRQQEPRLGHALLQIGHSRTNLVVYRDGHIVAIRSIEWGGHDIALSIESIFKIPYIEAIKVLQSKSFILMNPDGASRDQIAMHRAVSEAATPLIRELRMTLLDLRSSTATDLREIKITGGASQVQNFGDWIAHSIGIPISPLDYFASMTATGKLAFRVPHSPELENASATAIGLAVEGLRKARNPAINVRKGLFARSNESVKIFWDRWKTTIQITASIFVVFCIYSYARESISITLATESDSVLTDAAKKSAGLSGSQATAEGVGKYIRAETVAIKNRETLAQLDSYIPAMDIVVRLAERLPVQLPPRSGRGLDVDVLTIDNDDLTIEGRAQGTDVLANVERELKSIARAGTVKRIANPKGIRSGAPGTSFGFTMKIDRKI